MKRIISLVLTFVLLVGCVATFASCGKISQGYADKINKAAADKEYYTYDEVMEDLGDSAIDVTALKTGFVIAVKGCENWDEIEDKLDDGKTVKGLYITFVAGNATAAEYREITEKDKK
jgi:PBP1b-binding outer membrane lipoprotein LpoB